MILLSRLRRLWREERGVTAALTAISLTFMVGLSATAVDLGVAFTARNQLQNAADASALAAANTMIGIGAKDKAIAQPATALSTAGTIAGANKALGVNTNLKSPPGEDFVVGFYDTSVGDFDPDRTGLGISDPDDLTAARVRVRRDAQANTPVATYFARILGINQFEVSAVSTAYRGYPAGVPQGAVDLPIAVKDTALTNGDQPDCGKYLTFHSEGEENAEWTTFFTSPSNDNTVDDYVCGCREVPALSVGDQINVTNGNLSTSTWNHLRERFNDNKSSGQWQVTLPVVSDAGAATTVNVVGFTTFVITEVRGAPYKDLTGFLKCEVVIPGSTTGGANFGSRSATAKLVQ